MAIRDHQTRVAKLRGKVTTVDPSQMIVEVATVDGSARRLFITDISPAGFVWPREGEEWSIYEENGYWRLGDKFLDQDEVKQLQALNPGDYWPPDTEILAPGAGITFTSPDGLTTKVLTINNSGNPVWT